MSRVDGESGGGAAAAASGVGGNSAEPTADFPADAGASADDEEDLGDEDSADDDVEDEEDDEDEEDEDEGALWLSEDFDDDEFMEDDEDDADDFDSEPSDFDDDAMHFDIEGDVDFVNDRDEDDPDESLHPAAAAFRLEAAARSRARDDAEERGCYLLPDGEMIPSSTGMNHRQGADSVCAASPGRLLVTGGKDLRLLDADESSPTCGAALASTEQLPFDVYSVTYDPETSMVAVCGAPGADGDTNLAVFKVARGGVEGAPSPDVPDRRAAAAGSGAGSSASGPGSALFVRVADFGVGAIGRHDEREMLNCVRFGKMLDGGINKTVLLCASQDGHCYAYSLTALDSAGDGPESQAGAFSGFGAGGIGSGGAAAGRAFQDAAVSPNDSDGGHAAGRGARRRLRLDAGLRLEATVALPTACNAAASSPDGAFAACVGDFESLYLRGHRKTGYKTPPEEEARDAKDGGDANVSKKCFFSVTLPIDGDLGSPDAVLGAPEGGMYVAWSGDSRYVAATTDSTCAVAVWRVGIDVHDVTRVAFLCNHAHPCLPVTFLPSDPRVLVWAERGGRVHAYDLRRAERRLRLRKEIGRDVEAIDMSPPLRRYTGGGPAFSNEEDVLVSVSDPIPFASTDAASRRARVEAAKLERERLARRLQRITEPTPENTLARIRISRELRNLSDEIDTFRREVSERRFVQTVRSRVRGAYITGVCAITAPAPSTRRFALGSRSGEPHGVPSYGSLQSFKPPLHDLVFVGVPSGVLRFRAPTSWSPDRNHGDFPLTFRKASRAFLLCAEADSRRKRRAALGSSAFTPSTSLGDMPQEVLLRGAAAPISDGIEEAPDATPRRVTNGGGGGGDGDAIGK